MHILFAYRGTRQRDFDRLDTYPTSHMSEVNDVQICHAWRAMGHEVDVWVEKDGEPDPSKYDLLYLFKLHSVQKFISAGLLKLPWRRVAAWYDFGKLAQACGEERHKLESVAWGTPGLMEQEKGSLPGARHLVVEHATTFPSPPALPETQPRGLYIGRVPNAYRVQVEMASGYAPLSIFALKLELGGRMLLFRPGQYTEAELDEAQRWAGDHRCTFSPGVNLLADPSVATGCFGLVPSTKYSAERQVLSACKAWDYWALGLPVVCADNVPEAEWVRQRPMLGWLYRVGDQLSMHRAIEAALERAQDGDFPAHRAALQAWTFAGHTWKHRAEEIARAQFTS